MKNLQSIAIALLLAISVTGAAQDITEKRFTTDMALVMMDAPTGFRSIKGGYNSTEWSSRHYDSKLTIFGTGTSWVVYRYEEYFSSTNETVPEAYFYYQRFDTATPEGAFILANGERVMDEMAATMGWDKTEAKQERKFKKRLRDIIYRDNQGRDAMKLHFDSELKRAAVTVYSDLKPDDLPKYLGCIILYRSEYGAISRAIALYVYGDRIDSEQMLYANAIARMEKGGDAYTKYEWLPGAKERKVKEKLNALGISFSSETINPEGYGIKLN